MAVQTLTGAPTRHRTASWRSVSRMLCSNFGGKNVNNYYLVLTPRRSSCRGASNVAEAPGRWTCPSGWWLGSFPHYQW